MKTKFQTMLSSKVNRAFTFGGLLFFLMPGLCPADTNRAQKHYSPFSQPYISDHASLLSDEDEERIERWLWQIESKTDVEIIVVTIDSIEDYPGTPNETIEQFATALFIKYGIGNMPLNDEVLFLVAVSDTKARIELGAGRDRSRDTDARRIMNVDRCPVCKGIWFDGEELGLVLKLAELKINIPAEAKKQHFVCPRCDRILYYFP